MQKRMDELKAQMKAEAEKIFQPEALKLFEKWPELQSFSWTQYTPYFNDGDTCEFGANTDWPTVILAGATEEDIEDAYEGVVGESENAEEIEKDVKEFLAQINDELYQDMFGDHVEITVTAGGIEVEEYDHD